MRPRVYAIQACVRRRGPTGPPNICRTATRDGSRVTDPDVAPVDPGPLNPTPGSRTAGDALFPEIGNGGYNAFRYAIDLRYSPATNSFPDRDLDRDHRPGDQGPLPAQPRLRGPDRDRREGGGGDPATFNRVAPVACSPSPPAVPPCGETKLIVNPAEPIADDSLFTVRVSYSGTPQEHIDPDSSIEGWIRACSAANDPATCDGAFVVNQPIGAMTWFPSNNYPTDKALFDTTITVPSTHTAIGVGEFHEHPLSTTETGPRPGRGSEDDPTATYLTTATVGLFDLAHHLDERRHHSSQSLPVYTAIDSGCSPIQKAAATAALGETPQIVNFFNDHYGTYPFDSTGAVVDRTTGIGYALEVPTKPHYPSCTSTPPAARSSTSSRTSGSATR